MCRKYVAVWARACSVQFIFSMPLAPFVVRSVQPFAHLSDPGRLTRADAAMSLSRLRHSDPVAQPSALVGDLAIASDIVMQAVATKHPAARLTSFRDAECLIRDQRGNTHLKRLLNDAYSLARHCTSEDIIGRARFVAEAPWWRQVGLATTATRNASTHGLRPRSNEACSLHPFRDESLRTCRCTPPRSSSTSNSRSRRAASQRRLAACEGSLRKRRRPSRGRLRRWGH